MARRPPGAVRARARPRSGTDGRRPRSCRRAALRPRSTAHRDASPKPNKSAPRANAGGVARGSLAPDSNRSLLLLTSRSLVCAGAIWTKVKRRHPISTSYQRARQLPPPVQAAELARPPPARQAARSRSLARPPARRSLARRSLNRSSSIVARAGTSDCHTGQSNHMGVPSMQEPSLGLRTTGSLSDSSDRFK